MKHLVKTLVVSAALAVTTLAAQAAEKTLIISSWAPPTHGVNAILWPKLIEEIEKATDGRVTAEIKYGLAAPPAQFDLILDGAADITWIFHGYNPGRFVATKLIELPGYEGNAEAASVAYWRAHEKFLAPADEHRGVKLIALMTHGPGLLHSAEKVTRLDQISGMKLRLGGGVSGDVGAALGATGIRVPAPKVYETLASKAADGVMMPMEGKKSFKLYEVAPHTYTVPGGFYRGSFAIIMNQDTFEGLSDEDKAALEGVFGEHLSRIAGAMWDQIDAEGLETLKSTPGNTLNEATPEDAAKWQELTGPIIEKVLAEVAAQGIDAKAARDFIAETMANY
ncbi:TRAP-type C4-dicarboxylate transport system, substrate-binding protein [Meinhardsimonia xiamenensis]|jgi:TRAP-type C4-dicarboxylate transport system substrate-binding protein|uniref:TRAP-type C4-dicarboxylate transport system, substrate-binding protein n=1 Tax=Meinhardsimonia xiamenensis TaxID=990712 RepID=A0A1G8YJ31_9RHOB|nr:TRAP transporter substrate-binding protein [Meinhardsimonia xiamenensis]PRX37319.1 TRAP-type C4-dicarboxylate transport system substrate-binding protein [Meinhardsimonia xiamenensis]SDK02667.1 TRAP-type C4-dicarboxylate transport system, substrate-binding protein [Meinhardsimonia xiamenensis]